MASLRMPACVAVLAHTEMKGSHIQITGSTQESWLAHLMHLLEAISSCVSNKQTNKQTNKQASKQAKHASTHQVIHYAIVPMGTGLGS